MPRDKLATPIIIAAIATAIAIVVPSLPLLLLLLVLPVSLLFGCLGNALCVLPFVITVTAVACMYMLLANTLPLGLITC